MDTPCLVLESETRYSDRMEEREERFEQAANRLEAQFKLAFAAPDAVVIDTPDFADMFGGCSRMSLVQLMNEHILAESDQPLIDLLSIVQAASLGLNVRNAANTWINEQAGRHADLHAEAYAEGFQ